VIQGVPTTTPSQITVSLGPQGSEVITIPTPRTARDIDALKALVRDAFYGDRDDWKRMIFEQGAAAQRAALKGLQG